VVEVGVGDVDEMVVSGRSAVFEVDVSPDEICCFLTSLSSNLLGLMLDGNGGTVYLTSQSPQSSFPSSIRTV